MFRLLIHFNKRKDFFKMSACSASPVRWEGLSYRLIQFSPSPTAPRTSTTAIIALS